MQNNTPPADAPVTADAAELPAEAPVEPIAEALAPDPVPILNIRRPSIWD